MDLTRFAAIAARFSATDRDHLRWILASIAPEGRADAARIMAALGTEDPDAWFELATCWSGIE